MHSSNLLSELSAAMHALAPALLLGMSLVSIESVVSAQVVRPEAEYDGADQPENWTGKRVLVLTPHPDDDTFSVGGTMARLVAQGNEVRVLIYTNDNAGSRDPEMTRERLAAIRKVEEEKACEILGVPADRIEWLNYDDGMLEYADQRELTVKVVRAIRRFRPDAVFTIDPGAPYEQWHKSDHRMAAVVGVDAMRAAAWRLYFPELEKEGLGEGWTVPVAFLYYSANPNCSVDIHDFADRKFEASAAHMSQWGDLVDKYDPAKAGDEQRLALAKQLKTFSILTVKEEGRFAERFRRSTAYGG